MSDSLRPHGPYSTRLLCPWDSPGKNTEWVAIPFSGGSSQPRDPRIELESLTSPALADGFFTTSATWAVPDSGATAVIQEDTVKTRWMEMKPETCYSVAKLCSTLGTAPAAYQASLSFTISWSLLKLMSVESVMPSNHLVLVSLFSFCLDLFQCVCSLYQVAKVLEFQLQHQSFQ